MTPRSARLQDALDAFAKVREEKSNRQPDLFSVPSMATAEESAVVRAIKSVGDNAGAVWREQTLNLIRSVALELDRLTVDDLHAVGVPPTHDARALGHVMVAAAKKRWIRSTGEFRISERPETHRRPLRVWESLLRGPDAA